MPAARASWIEVTVAPWASTPAITAGAIVEDFGPGEREVWQRLLEETRAWDGDVLISHEHFSDSSAEAAAAALADLASEGAADSLQQEGESLYRACTPGSHHHHLICRRCGTTVEIAADAVETWARDVAAQHGFTQPHHVVDVFGYCADCTRILARDRG